MKVWEEINLLVEKFFKKKIHNLSSLLRRAADSIALHISEGSIVQSRPEFRKFISYTIRSLAEVITCLHKARNRAYLKHNKFENFY